MRHLFAKIGFGFTLIVAVLLVPGTALAAGPDHQIVNGTDSDPDFCGTGKVAIVSSRGLLNGWPDKATGHIAHTWTNPLNGASVVETFSGGGTVAFLDDGDGAYTVVSTRFGIQEQLRLVRGPVLTLDAGKVITYDHFDADDNYLGTDVTVKGPHPELDSGFGLFCEVMTEALGL